MTRRNVPPRADTGSAGKQAAKFSDRRAYPYQLAISVAVLGLATAAGAVPVAPGTYAFPTTGTSEALRPELAGVVVADVTRPFKIDMSKYGGGIISGTIQDRVVRENRTGTLDFYYRVINDRSSSGYVHSEDRSSMKGFDTDADFRTDGLGTVGLESVWLSPDGSTIRFISASANPSPKIHPGDESRFFFVRSNATAFDERGTLSVSGASDIAQVGAGVSLKTFQPIERTALIPWRYRIAIIVVVVAAMAMFAVRRSRRPASLG